MKVNEVISEAALQPNENDLSVISEIIDMVNVEYQQFLDENNDQDDIEELAEILNSYSDTYDLPITWHVDNEAGDSNEWVRASANFNPETGETYLDVLLVRPNIENEWGPKTFKDITMELLTHEYIHFNQYSRMNPEAMKGMKSGFQKGVEKFNKSGKMSDVWRNYLRDPLEQMAYGNNIANEIKKLSEKLGNDPLEILRNIEEYKDHLNFYKRFRMVFPRNARPIQNTLKYTYKYLKSQ